MTLALGSTALGAGYRLKAFESVGSTNTLAMQAARDGDPGRLWHAALQQTEGRGRRGRPWATDVGNLAASLLLVFEREAPDIAGLGFVAGVALAEALSSRIGDGPAANISLKWPNDVLLNGAKLSGILLEAEKLRGGGQAVVIGIGVNIVSAPAGLPYPATSLREADLSLDAGDVLPPLSDAFAGLYDLWRGGDGLPDILAAWRQQASGIGAPITVTTPAGQVSGVFETLDNAGRLVIRGEDGDRTTISAGDVHFGSATTART